MKKINFVFCWFALVVIVLWALMAVFINPIIVKYSQAKIEAMTVKAINRSVSDIVSVDIYKDLTVIKYDAGGKITSLTTNMLEMNSLSSDIALAAQGYIELFASEGITVPAGTFSGLPLFTGKGPNINLRVVPVGSVNCSFLSEFTGMGINQTRHRIVLEVKSIVNLILPFAHAKVSAVIGVMLCESIIVGEVPEFFWSR